MYNSARQLLASKINLEELVAYAINNEKMLVFDKVRVSTI